MADKVSMIGDYLGTIEEFVPGSGTYAEDGKIYASNVGKSVLDKQNHTVSVSAKSIGEPKVGQVVYGEVTGLRKNVASVNVSRIKGLEMPVKIKSEIYVSNIADKYVDKPENFFGIGDIVEAQIIKIEPNGVVDLSTKGDFGVVKAFCKACRAAAVKSDKFEGKIECPSCGAKEQRKIAKDYGNVVL